MKIKVDKETGLSYAKEGLYDEFYRIRGGSREALEGVKSKSLVMIEYKPEGTTDGKNDRNI